MTINNQNKKGFAGLLSLVSDIDKIDDKQKEASLIINFAKPEHISPEQNNKSGRENCICISDNYVEEAEISKKIIINPYPTKTEKEESLLTKLASPANISISTTFYEPEFYEKPKKPKVVVEPEPEEDDDVITIQLAEEDEEEHQQQYKNRSSQYYRKPQQKPQPKQENKPKLIGPISIIIISSVISSLIIIIFISKLFSNQPKQTDVVKVIEEKPQVTAQQTEDDQTSIKNDIQTANTELKDSEPQERFNSVNKNYYPPAKNNKEKPKKPKQNRNRISSSPQTYKEEKAKPIPKENGSSNWDCSYGYTNINGECVYKGKN